MHGRCWALLVLLGLTLPAFSQESRTIERLLYESLREAHDTGADLYNKGEASDCYRMFQGALITARGLLSHRPELQKSITDGMAKADREESVMRRAFLHHELIEKVRSELRGGPPASKKGETLTIPPREVKNEVKPKPEPEPKIIPKPEPMPKVIPKPEPKPEPKPMGKVDEIKTGVMGRVLWMGQPLGEVEIAFVTVGQAVPRVYETVSGAQGVYLVPILPAGQYVITLVPSPKCVVKKLPERYATTTTTPLLVEVRGQGEKLDFVLQ